jgi:hypothetical protein
MTSARRKNNEPRHLAQRYTLRRRVQSAKFTRAGDRHVAHAEDENTPVGASGSPVARPVADETTEADLRVAGTERGSAPLKETNP